MILRLARERFNLIAAVIGDAQGRAILTTFYYTVLVPFSLLARSSGDTLQLRGKPTWLDRDAVPDDIDSALDQG